MVKTKAKYIQICNSYVVSNSLGCLFPWQYKMYPDKDTGKKFPARKKKIIFGFSQTSGSYHIEIQKRQKGRKKNHF